MKSKLNLKDRINDGELDLAMSELVEVPVKEIAQFSKITSLDLSNNHLQMLSKQFTQLVQLVKLDLSKNKLTELPEEFGNLIKLRSLDLYSNQLTHLPLSFGNLRALKFLDLKDNPLMPAVAKIVGPCLDAQQCSQSAKNAVQFYAQMQHTVEEEKGKREAQRQKSKEQKQQQKQPTKSKQSSKRTKEKKELAEVTEESKNTKIRNDDAGNSVESEKNPSKAKQVAVNKSSSFARFLVIASLLVLIVSMAVRYGLIKENEVRLMYEKVRAQFGS